ncbi:MAG TPA: UDP-N-acetylglucosamine 2-epimerase (non-hydrolyzing) [Thermoanaerobaculia bacterium]|nr:UDP-N-acetylglucosamine 2-epimerase (non-hydrolyzing) [Thermoanaerobaculia bacterium]
MSELRVLAVAGCRPNFVKLGPLMRELRRHDAIRPLLVHTGQHYDHRMSGVFFRDLALPAPDVHLEVGSGSHAVQTARVMERMETALLEHLPDLVLLVGDVNSTVAAALTAVKLGIPVAHVEAGLRSFDREMPEEVNRVLTDAISDLLFATEPSAVENLRREGIADGKVHFVGNVMVDALLASLPEISRSNALERFGLRSRGYAVLTLHRPDNVEDPEAARRIVAAVAELARRLPVVFPVHPRTRARFEAIGLWAELEDAPGILPTGPLGYLDFLRLVQEAALVLTDSGGLQEESTVLGVPCVTLRESTERPVTVAEGTNRLAGRDPRRILAAADEALGAGREARREPARVPELWDGRAAERIVEVLLAEAGRIRELYRNLRERTTWRRLPASAA